MFVFLKTNPMSKKPIDQVNEPDGWGGTWTEQKIEVFLKYLKAYLDIMKTRPFELVYFDGFAGSGDIEGNPGYGSALEGIALRVLGMQHDRTFDIYYLVDKDPKKVGELKSKINDRFPSRLGIYPVAEDCNEKLRALANYLRSSKDRRALALIDPFGMQVNWESIEACKDLGVDLWILVPTGIGVGRMLKNDGNISDAWLTKLESFLGISGEEIKEYFYQERTTHTLFGEERHVEKEAGAAHKAAELYVRQLKKIWKHASEPLPLRNSTNSIMYHFVLATNSHVGLRIGNDIIGKELSKM